ncbi:MAG: hypothetical protein AB7U82_34890 [Blastocatellales bacterium]
MNDQLFDYPGACDDLRQMLDRTHAVARSGLVTSVCHFAEELITAWQEFYALA